MSESPASASAPQGNTAPVVNEKYRCGTLVYTKLGIVSLFGWMIMANLCFGLFEGNGGAASIPFYLQDNFHISNTMVMLLFSFIPMLIGTFMTPVVSFWSDRTRSRLGRRIPYILFTAPFLVLFAIALGFSDDIIAVCKVHFATSPTIAPLGAALFVIGFLTIGWSFFNEFVGTVFYYLLPDVMPQHFLGRFQGVCGVAGTLLGFAMNTWVGPYQLTHIKAIHVGVAILYFVGFGLVCWRVKEGQYPPVEDVTKETTFREKVKLYFKECFNHPMYIMLYLITAVNTLTTGLYAAGVFGLHLGQHQSTIVAHANVSDALATTPDNAWMVSGGQDGLVKVFQGPGTAFKEINVFDATNHGAYACLAVSPNGGLAAIGRTNGTIEIWDAVKNQRLQTFAGHTGGVAGVAFTGAKLVSAGADQDLRIWDVHTDQCVKVMTGLPDVRALAATPDGKWIVTATGSNTVQRRDAATGAITKTIACQTDCARGVSVSKDGKVVATCSSDGTMEVWDVLEMPVLKLRIKPDGAIRAFSLSADGHDLMACYDQRLSYWDVATGANLGAFSLPESEAVQTGMTPDGRLVFFAASDGRIHVCQRPGKTFKFVHALSRQGAPISCLALTQSGEWLALGSTNGWIEIWNMTKDELVRTLDTHAGPVACLAFPREGAWLASAGSDQTIRIWDSTTGAPVKALPAGADVKILAMTPDSRWLASGAGKGAILCRDTGSGAVVKKFSGRGKLMDGLSFSADGKTLASHSMGGPIEVWAVGDEARIPYHWWSGLLRAVTFDRAGKDLLTRFKFNADVKAIKLTPDGAEVSACSERDMKSWSVAANRQTKVFTMQTASTSVAMTPDGKSMISGGKDGTLTFWDVSNSKKPVLVRTILPRSGAPLAVDLSADGRTAVSGALSGAIDVWDTASGQCMLTLTGHTAFVRSVAFSPGDDRLVSASADKTARIWDVKSGACLKTLAGHEDEVNSAAFSSTGDRVVSGGSDRKIIVWDAATGAIVQTMEGSPGPVYAVCFAPAIGPVPASERPNQSWYVATSRYVWDFLKNVFSNESFYKEPADRTSRILGEDRWVVSGGRDGETDEVNSNLRIWDVGTGRLIPAIEELGAKSLKGHKKAIVSVAYKPDIRMILSASPDESIRLWAPLDIGNEITRTADDQSYRSFSGYTRAVTGMAFQRADKVLVNASANGTLHVWDIDQGVSLLKGSRYRGNFFLILTLLLSYPVGVLVDRWKNPIRIVLWTSFLSLPVTLSQFLFFHDYMSGLWIGLALMPMGVLGGMANLPMMVMLFPKSKYGQYSSANAMIRQSIGSFAGILGAMVMDHLTDNSYDTDRYRYGFLFKFTAHAISFMFLVGVYLYWKKMGGEKYVAPEGDGKHLERAQAAAAKTA